MARTALKPSLTPWKELKVIMNPYAAPYRRPNIKELDNDVLGQILRTFNDPALNHANGDVFGRIYEYFLTQFANQKAHDDGEFFTPASLVQMIVNIIEPDDGRILDPACGSGGMFVQSAHFIERMQQIPTERVTFFGMEKNATTIRLAQHEPRRARVWKET